MIRIKSLQIVATLLVAILTVSCGRPAKTWNDSEKELAKAILEDQTLAIVDSMGRSLLLKGYNAGTSYSQVWIRDFNTFIETVLEVVDPDEVKNALKYFFLLQQPNGEILDGYMPKESFPWGSRYEPPYYNDADAIHIGFKNTVETDQETSLIQAVRKYVEKTGNTAFLKEELAGESVYARLSKAVDYLIKEKYNPDYGLLTGALTCDWGDVDNIPGQYVDFGPESTTTIDIYDNAMLVIALRDLEFLSDNAAEQARWRDLRGKFEKNVRRFLWDSKNKRFITHIYPEGKPECLDFDESQIYYHGGTAVAIEAGLLSQNEIVKVNADMLQNVRKSGMPSIGLTVYPTYPAGFFPDEMSEPFIYQNGGDWTWFGGRMIQQLIRSGFVAEAYQEIRPMIDRVIVNGDFYEWYGQGCVPRGSAAFKGSAGVLCKAIGMLQEWAESIEQ